MSELNAGLIGTELAEATFTVDREAIRRFAVAIDDPSPSYVDDATGRASAWGDIVAPPTFAVTLRDEEAYTTRFWAGLGVSMSQVLNAEVELECIRPILPGCTYIARVRIADLYEKRGKSGRLVFVKRETVIRQAVDAQVVAVLRHTNVVREARG
ncbi:MAG TPA: MaoC family dehydratase N-terminal domain-containing protein [Ramlibacter sp.]|uniref:FAS1-like dehydratase domain-containing protein n=1 Tax=Ramlibacter sp. TaxID=1917967 RepID=UPI002C6E297A|nr:MaoC family dehydratase N-terminal domain-containing protein [Ramlibacter sp.]HVZ42650.1 MaoC family dehydratase N-terminal domain-containing protein [Ramlibacter sp.]